MPSRFRTRRPSIGVFAALAAFAWLAAGCAAPRYTGFPVHRAGIELPDDPAAASPRDLPIFSGCEGQPLRWGDLLDACDWAEIIIIGEQHDDGMGHAVQRAAVEDVFDRLIERGGVSGHVPGVLALEMLERDDQMVTDDYLEAVVDAATFIRLTHSANWGGEGKWEEWYQPIVDAAKQRGARVVAANAPRRYVRLARLEGYERLRRLPRDRRAMFDLPRASERAFVDYRARFGEVMRHGHDDDAGDAQERRIDAAFRSQRLWDSTMAASIVREGPRRDAKVIHLVGQFHSDFDGGLVQEIRARRPQVRILTISMQREWRDSMREEDLSRADVIIYTGERPPKDAAEQEEDE